MSTPRIRIEPMSDGTFTATTWSGDQGWSDAAPTIGEAIAAAKRHLRRAHRETVRVYHSSCHVERTCKVTHYTMNMVTGEQSEPLSEEMRTKPCGTPLFGDDERDCGVCRSCAGGWTAPNNYATERGKAQIASAKEVRG
jgi:hypothetical protein